MRVIVFRKAYARKALTAVVLALLPFATYSQQPEDPAWVKEIAAKRIVFSVPGMDRIQPRKDIVYKRAGNSLLKMDIYQPSSPRRGGRAPVVLFIHGGRVPANLVTTPKNWGAFVSFAQLAAASGFVGITFNHRFHTWESLGDSQSDIAGALKYVRDHADEFHGDPNRVVLWTISAGGIFLSEFLRERPAYIKCLVAYYPELDLQTSRGAAPPSVTDQTLRDFSPVAHLTDNQGMPPIFIARAGLDDPDLNAGVNLFLKLALEKNLTIDVMNHPTGHHGFDSEDNDERSREIIKRTIEFIREHTRL